VRELREYERVQLGYGGANVHSEAKLEGLEKLQKELAEFQRAISSLDGTICQVRFNPEDEASIQEAVSQMERAVAAKVAKWRNSKMIIDIAKAMKLRYREKILRS
jgi:hypothetical protein